VIKLGVKEMLIIIAKGRSTSARSTGGENITHTAAMERKREAHTSARCAGSGVDQTNASLIHHVVKRGPRMNGYGPPLGLVIFSSSPQPIPDEQRAVCSLSLSLLMHTHIPDMQQVFTWWLGWALGNVATWVWSAATHRHSLAHQCAVRTPLYLQTRKGKKSQKTIHYRSRSAIHRRRYQSA
jgi:hypothetical protein